MKEVRNLDFIKEGLTDSKRVMKHIAAIVHGDEFMIILPLATLYNLDIFLRGGYEPDPGTDELKPIYNFETIFPLLNTSVNLQTAVVKEAHQLASALKWLHEDLKIWGSSDRYLAHMDLKPANVLLVGDSQSPAGKWMLSDFGVSSFDKATNARVRDTPSIGDVGLRFTSRGFQDNIIRGRGPYQPPEVELDNVDSRKCDVWSFGCVLCDILAFAIGKTKAVNELRRSRYGPDDDYFYETRAPTKKKIKSINDVNTSLKPQIIDWWTELEGSSPRWVINYIKVLRKAMKPKPSDRPDIKNIVEGLDRLAPSINFQTNGALVPDSETASTMSQTDRLAPQNTLGAQGQSPFITISRESSPQPHESGILEDLALTDGDHGQSSRNFLTPYSTPNRDRVLAAEHERDDSQASSSTDTVNDEQNGSQSASSTDVPNDVVAHPDAVQVVPDVSPPPSTSPGRDTARASISAYQEGPKISISLPRKENVKAVAITSSADQAAVLFKHSVQLYSTIDGVQMGGPINLSPNDVNWTKIRLASRYLAVYGLGVSHEKHVSPSLRSCNFPATLCPQCSWSKIKVFDSSTSTVVKEAIYPLHHPLPQDLLLSDKGVFAYVYGQHVDFYFTRSVDPTLSLLYRLTLHVVSK